MSILSEVVAGQGSGERPGPLGRLLNDGCRVVGGVYGLDYDNATVLTDDRKKHEAGGVPHGAYLLAADCTTDGDGYQLADEELILLRVRGVERLPNEAELTALRIGVVQDADARGTDLAATTDHLTLAEQQRSAFACDVIGTFWTDPDTGQVSFGADLDNVVASVAYRVFLPSRSTLEWLASFPEPTEDADLLEIGTVRFSATRRRASATGLDGAEVRVHVSDFLARKTAVLGMTRTGKDQPLTARVPVPVTPRFPQGWATIGELEVGDLVYAGDGSPTAVVGLSPVLDRPLHRVVFSDGQVVECGPEHLWRASDVRSRILFANRTTRTDRLAAQARRTAERGSVAEKFRAMASEVPVGTVASVHSISRMTGVTKEKVRACLNRSGVEKHLGVATHVVTAHAGAAVYPLAETLAVLATDTETVYTGAPGRESQVPLERVVSTTEMMQSLEAERSGEMRTNWAVKVAPAIAGEQVDLPIDPYLLGAWLGDGHSGAGLITSAPHTLDDDGLSDQHWMLHELRSAGYDAAQRGDSRGWLISVPGLRTTLRETGLLGDKHIPTVYLRASVEQRLALLQGLMDTDGTVDRDGGCEIALSDERLAAGLRELLRSLGIKVAMRTSPAGYRDQDGNYVACKDRHRMSFVTTRRVFRLPRKAARLPESAGSRRDWRYVVDIETGDEVPMRCISVAHPEGMYLTEEFVPTHNSNSIKTLATAVHRHGSLTGQRVGQLIFDPQGEYSEFNEQDGTALRLIGDADTVRVYRMHADASDPQVRPLGMNFFDLSKTDMVADFVNDAVSRDYGSYAYVKDFTSIDWTEPKASDVSAWAAWSRARVGLYGLLRLCGFRSASFADPDSTDPTLTFTWSAAEFHEFDTRHPGLVLAPQGGSKYRATSPDAAAKVTLFMADRGTWNTSRSNDSDVRPFSFIATALKRAALRATVRTLKDFHSSHSTQPVEEQVWDDMVNGRLAIVDLSRGTGDVPRIISENIVNYLLRKESERFVSGSCVPVQVVVEEAHTLFERDSQDVAGNPWVRLAKEAAKYRVGLVYATQEVTSVDRRILANTSNWLIAHLNSDRETAELSHYYDFGAYADSLRKVDDVGLVRMKTHSGRYVVPVQVAKFDDEMIQRARIAAGLGRNG